MSSLNKVILLGNLTRDPEIRQTASGMAVGDLGIALNRVYKSEYGDKTEEVTFVDVTVWGRQAELARDYCFKGKQVAIEGRLQLDNWEGKHGKKRSKLKVVAENIIFTGSKTDQERPQEPRQQPVAQQQPSPQSDNIPGLGKGNVPGVDW